MTFDELREEARQQGIRVYTMQFDAVSSISAPIGAGVIGYDPGQMQNQADACVHVAHELGHCVRGAFYNDSTPLQTRARQEWKAAKWSYRFLLPKEVLLQACREPDISPEEIAERFNVTVEFLLQALAFYRSTEDAPGEESCEA